MKKQMMLLPVLLVSATPLADEKSPWQFNLQFGIESDSNVVVEDVERNSAADSLSYQSRVSLGYNHKTKNKSEFGASYSFSRKDYNSLDSFDTDIHLVNLKASHKFKDAKVGINATRAKAYLDDDAFVVYEKVTPNVSYYFDKKNFIYLSYTLGEKTFEDLHERSADQQELGFNYYHLLQGLNHYLTAGLEYKDEDAEEHFYSYQQWQFKLSYNYRSRLFDMPTRLKLSYRYQDRDHDSDEHPLLGEFRQDERNQLKLNYRISLPNNFFSEIELTGNFNQSNLEAADYDQTKFGILIGYKFN